MGSPGTFNLGSVDGLGTGPTLGGTHDNHRPSRLSDGFSATCGLLDLSDLSEGPFH